MRQPVCVCGSERLRRKKGGKNCVCVRQAIALCLSGALACQTQSHAEIMRCEESRRGQPERERERDSRAHTRKCTLTSYPSRAARCSRVSPAFLLTMSRRASGGMGLLTGGSADTGGAGATGGTGTSGTAHGGVGGAAGWKAGEGGQGLTGEDS